MTRSVKVTVDKEDRGEARFIDDDAMTAWLESWGSDDELPLPKPKCD